MSRLRAPGRSTTEGDPMAKHAADGTDHTVDPGVLPSPSTVEYDVEQPEGTVETFDTGVIYTIK